MSQARIFYALYAVLICGAVIAGYKIFGDTPAQPGPNPLVNSPIQQSPLLPETQDTEEATLQIERIELTAARSDLTSLELASAGAQAEDMLLPVPPSDPGTPQLGCDAQFKAAPAKDAQVALTLTAPCHGAGWITVHHNGMIFSDRIGKDGAWSVNVPALSEQAHFMIDLGKGIVHSASTQVDGFDSHARIVLQWTGDAGFQLHAREFGAGYGEPGHLWYGTSQKARGSLVRLGSPDALTPKFSEIYTYPKAEPSQQGLIALSIETEVTTRNCGRDIEAQTLELRGNEPLVARDLTLSMPNCAAIGDFLVLNNLLDSLKIASNQTK